MVMDKERLAWIVRHKHELARRYEAAMALLTAAGAGEDIDLRDIELASRDLSALLDTMLGHEDGDEEAQP